MNKLLTEMPKLGSEAYASAMPKWLSNLLRLIFIMLAIGVTWLGFSEWAKMPLFTQIIICILPPVFLFSAFSSSGWAQCSVMPFFLADCLGMYFKHKNALITHLGKDAQLENSLRKHWLFTPWESI